MKLSSSREKLLRCGADRNMPSDAQLKLNDEVCLLKRLLLLCVRTPVILGLSMIDSLAVNGEG
jgi:hypothetical protein